MVSPVDHDAAFKRYMDGLLTGDIRVMKAIIDDLIEVKTPLNHIYRDFVQQGLYEIGMLWERNEITVSIEHLAATATKAVLAEMFLQLPRIEENSPEVIIACVPGEMHDVGAMVVANLTESVGCKSVLLGADTPTKDMLAFFEHREHMPDLLALSTTLPANRVALDESLAAVTAKCPHLRIVIGGQALHGHEEAVQFRSNLLDKYPTVDYVQTLDELEQYLNLLAKGA
jgi:MerR family transcriptional regulator, light-induced transcriptional regulator